MLQLPIDTDDDGLQVDVLIDALDAYADKMREIHGPNEDLVIVAETLRMRVERLGLSDL